MVPIDVHDIHDEVGELALDGHGIIPVQGGVVHPVGVGGDLPDQRHQLLPQGGEEGVALGHRQATLKGGEHGLVGVLLRLPVAGHAAAGIKHLLEIGLEEGKVVLLLGLMPYGVGLGGQLLIGHIFRHRDTVGAVVVTPQLLRLPAGDGVQLLTVFHKGAEHLHRLRGGGELIAHAGELT